MTAAFLETTQCRFPFRWYFPICPHNSPVRSVGTIFSSAPSGILMNYRSVWLSALMACAQAQSPSTIAYTCAPDGGPPWPVQDVCTVRISSSAPQNLTGDGHSHDPSWSPDGKWILFIHDAPLSTKPEYRETEESKTRHAIELSVIGADGHNRRVLRVIEPVIYSAAWSADGNLLAISASTSVTPGQPPQPGLFLLPANGKGELRLLVENGWTPSWSPDGSNIAFTVEQPRGHWTLHTAKRNGLKNVRLTDASRNSGSPAWSPDGKRIAFDQFVDGNGRQQVFVMNSDGFDVRPITTDAAWSCGHPSWSLSGDELVIGCRSAESPCGMGFFATGQPMPYCTRRLFAVPVGPGAVASPKKVMDHDGAIPSVAPR
jgi:Tol biopolymer transport system component